MASGSRGGKSSLHTLIGGRATTAARRSRAGGKTQSVRSFYKEMRQMGASRSEAREMARTYAANTRAT